MIRKSNDTAEILGDIEEFKKIDLNTAELFEKHEVSVWQIIASDDPTAKPKDMTFSMGSAVAISPSKLQTSELFTSDYSVFFLSYIPGYLCLAYAFSVCATSVL